MLEGMDRAAFDQRILFTGIPRQPQPEFDRLGLPHAFLDLPAQRTRQSEWRELKRFLEAQAPCIYIPNYDFHRSCAAATLSPSVRICAVIHSDEICWYDEVRRLGGSFNAIVAVSAQIANRLRQKFPQLVDRLARIPYGIPLPAPRQKRGSHGKVLHLAYCNRLAQYQKRVFDLPRIAAELKRRQVAFHLTVAGDGSDADALRGRFRQAGINGDVTFTGRIPNTAVIGLLKDSDAFLLTSDFEGLPISLLEAMSTGCVPVVYQIDSGIEEVIQPGLNGFVVPHGNISAFADVLERMASDRSIFDRMGTEATRTVGAKYSITGMCEAYASLFSRLIQSSSPEIALRRDSRMRIPRDLTLMHRLLRRLKATGLVHNPPAKV